MDNNTVGCAYCGELIVLGVDDPKSLVDLPVYKCGELDSLEIAHVVCHRLNSSIAAEEAWAVEQSGAPWRYQKMRQEAEEAAKSVEPHVVGPDDDIPF
jgi:hypothetical protein